MMDIYKSIIALLLVAVIFLSGALAGKYTGMPIVAVPASSLSADTLSVKTVSSPTAIVNFTSHIKSAKTIMGVATAGDIGVSGSSISGRGVFGRSETGYGIEGYANAAAGYSGFFHGGKGLYTDKISFGTEAFAGGMGQLVLLAENGHQCANVCLSHGLSCRKTLAIEGSATAMNMRDVLACGYGTGLKFCICG